MRIVVLLAFATGACALAGPSPDRERLHPPRHMREAPLPGGYPDSAARAPRLLVGESRWAAIGRETAERRVLAGRGPAFLATLESRGGGLPVRRAVWTHDAFPVAASGELVAFATAWLPVSRLEGELHCGAGRRGRSARARLVGLFHVVGPDLRIEAWMETDGAPACMGRRAARDRVRGFADDLDRYVRATAHPPLPTRGSWR